jgi:hypothetical protein
MRMLPQPFIGTEKFGVTKTAGGRFFGVPA